MFNEEVARNSGVTRVVAVVLTEAEWRALRALEPKPAAWLQQVVRERVEQAADGTDAGARPYELLDDPEASRSEQLA
jgi:hypothetical protein